MNKCAQAVKDLDHEAAKVGFRIIFLARYTLI